MEAIHVGRGASRLFCSGLVMGRRATCCRCLLKPKCTLPHRQTSNSSCLSSCGATRPTAGGGLLLTVLRSAGWFLLAERIRHVQVLECLVMCFAIEGAAADPSSISLMSRQQGLSKAPMPSQMLHSYLNCLFSCTPDNPPKCP